MYNTKMGNREAIALLITIVFNHIIINSTKAIIDTTGCASFINVLYIGVIAIIFTSIICYFLNKFPTYDLIDISEYLGGKLLKWIVGMLFAGYFIFFAGVLLNIFTVSLEIMYFQLVKTIFIVSFFIISAVISCLIKNNAIYRTNFIILLLVIGSTAFLFIADFKYFLFEKAYPLLGNGFFSTFVSGLSNMFAFQALAYIYFLPPSLKNANQLKKIAIISIIISCILLLISVALLIFMFNGFVEADELLPLFTAVKYIEFGSFFQKLDPLFILIWIISFVSYLSIAIKFSSNILKKLTNVENENIFIILSGIAVLLLAIWQKNYAISIFLARTVYKYAFFILVIGISFFILLLASAKQKVRKWFK